MSISVRNEVEDGKYHVLTKDTVLIVDGEKWTAEPDSLYTYYSLADGYGMMSFVSEEMDVIPLANVSDSTPRAAMWSRYWVSSPCPWEMISPSPLSRRIITS